MGPCGRTRIGVYRRTVAYNNEGRIAKYHKILLLQSLPAPFTNAGMYRLFRYGSDREAPGGIAAASQVITGFGLGLLVAGKVRSSARKPAALALIGAGIATLVPIIMGMMELVANRPTSKRLMKRRLESIRRGSGLSETGSV